MHQACTRPRALRKRLLRAVSPYSFTTGHCDTFHYKQNHSRKQLLPRATHLQIVSLMGLSNSLFQRRALNDSSVKPRRGGSYKVKDRPAGDKKFPDVAAELKSRIQRLYTQYLTADGTGVDYKGIESSQEFEDYLEATHQLAKVDQSYLMEMEREEKIAFFINIYNALTIHSNIVCGHPKTSLARIKLNAEACYNIGGLLFSLSEIENGILRANSSFLVFGPPFSNKKNDPRLQIALPEPERRAHFALNCSARSCPPILYFTKDNLEFGLSSATANFLEDDENLLIAKDENMVRVSMIFKWYKKDFAQNLKDEEVLKWIAANMDQDSEKRMQLLKMLDKGEAPGGRKIKLKHLPYNWDLNEVTE